MKTETLKNYEIQLLRLRDRLRAEIQDRVDTVPEKMQAQGDVTSLPTHRADHDVEGLDAEVGAGEAQNQTLADVEAALKRIEKGNFGTCVSCGNPIAEERLKALPYTELCIDCETKRESD